MKGDGDGQHVYGTPSFKLAPATSKTKRAPLTEAPSRPLTDTQDTALTKLIAALAVAVFKDAGEPLPPHVRMKCRLA